LKTQIVTLNDFDKIFVHFTAGNGIGIQYLSYYSYLIMKKNIKGHYNLTKSIII